MQNQTERHLTLGVIAIGFSVWAIMAAALALAERTPPADCQPHNTAYQKGTPNPCQ